MAWNPSPRVGALRDFADKFEHKIVVAFSINDDGESFELTTYGKTKKLCKLAAHFGDQIAKAVLDGVIVPPATEPFDVAPSRKVWTAEEGSDE